MKQLSEWCSDLGSHELYDWEMLKKDFEESTGKKCPFGGYQYKHALATVGDPKGLLNPNVSIPKTKMVCDGHDVVYSVWREFGQGRDAERIGRIMGRGFLWSACIKALKEVEEDGRRQESGEPGGVDGHTGG